MARQTYKLRQIDPKKITFNRANPRGETIDDILADPSFEQLKDSVYRYGVLVPVVVHARADDRDRFKLVDGERRVRAALATGVHRIPAHVASTEKPTDDLLQAFQIHMLRKQWKPVAQARALKRIIHGMKSAGEFSSEDELLDELQGMTGCSDTQLKTLQRAIRFPDAVLDEVERGELAFSHLVQIEESAIEQLESKLPELLKEVGEEAARESLLNKARRKTLTDTRALMLNIVPVLQRAKMPEQREYARERLKEFLSDDRATAEDVLRDFEKTYPSTDTPVIDEGHEILKWARELRDLLECFEPASLDGYPTLAREMRTELEALRTVTNKRLRGIRTQGG